MKTLVIIGYGFLGSAVGSALNTAKRDDIKIVATVRSPARRQQLVDRGVNAFELDINRWQQATLDTIFAHQALDLVFMLPPSRLQRGGATVAEFVDACKQFPITNALLISSTGVYGRPEAESVTAETAPQPHDSRSRRLLQIEDAWRSGGENHRILRLAGLYGPGRVIGRDIIRQGRPVGGDPQAWLNLIHVDDAAELALRCLSSRAATNELGADGEPVRRAAYYHYLAQCLGLADVSFSGQAARSVVSKRCDPTSTFARLGWRPRFPNYRVGLADALAGDR